MEEKKVKTPSAQAIQNQKSVIQRLNKVEGQIRGIKKMIEGESYCDDIINQIEASRSALHSIQIILLESHIKSCVVNQVQQGDTEVIDEILKTFKKLTK